MPQWDLLGTIDLLPYSLLPQLGKPTVVKVTSFETVSQLMQHDIRKGCSNYKYVMKGVHSDDYAIFENYNQDYLIQYSVTKDFISQIDLKDTGVLSYSTSTIQRGTARDYHKNTIRQALSLWEEDSNEYKEVDETIIMMKPPNYEEIMTSKSQYNDIKLDPKVYFRNKYYEYLYSFKIPLTYFVKTNLIRLKNNCKATYREEYVNGYHTILLEMLLKIPEFDRRYENDYILLNNDFLNSPSEVENRTSCLKEYHISAASKKNERSQSIMNDLILILKAREIKLQIIILLELIYTNKLDESFHHFEKKYNKNLKRRSLKLTKNSRLTRRQRKNSKKDDDSTVETRSPGSKKKKDDSTTNIDYCELLDLYLDKLAIFEILLDTTILHESNQPIDYSPLSEFKRHMLNKSQESSSLGFVSYVLIPYFNKSIPHTIKFVFKKLKGPSLRNRKSTEKRTVSPTSSLSLSNATTSTNEGANSLPKSIQRKASLPSHTSHTSFTRSLSRQSSTGLTSFAIQNMDRANSNLSDFLDAEITVSRSNSLLSRTKSDLLMNNLQKRQLPVTTFDIQKKSKSKTESSTTSSTVNNRAILRNQHSFRRVGIRKDQLSVKLERQDPIEENNIVDIMATPIKSKSVPPINRNNLLSIVESPPVNESIRQQPNSRTPVRGDSHKRNISTLHSENVLNPSNDNNIEIAATPMIRRVMSTAKDKFDGASIVESPKNFEQSSSTATGAQSSETIKYNIPPTKKKVRRRLFAP